jgi:putative glycosyltransferase
MTGIPAAAKNPAGDRPRLSIVSTLYNSAPYIEEFHDRATRAARAFAGDAYEIVLVNDGSPDDSLARAVEIALGDPHVTVVDLSRNFGHHKAMMTGLAHASGELVFLIDSDLEEDPDWLATFADTLQAEKCDVVFGVQKSRKGNRFERWTGHGFYWLFNLITGLALPANVIVARLMTRRYVEALLLHDEREVFLAGLWHITGFTQKARSVEKLDKGTSSYTIRRKLSLLVNSITSFSNKPLVSIFYTGFSISILSMIYIIYIIMQKYIFLSPLEGWTSVMASIWLIGGMIILFLGVIGIYIAKIYSETKRRPYTIVKQIYKS